MKRSTDAIVGLFALLGMSCAFAGPLELAADDDQSPSIDVDGDRFFENKVRPLLSQHCFKCHSESAKKRQGGLHLDSRSGVLAGGDSGAIVAPADPEQSRLLLAVRQTEPGLKMPPGKRLSDEEIAIISEWIKRGIPFPETRSTRKSNRDSAAHKPWSFERPAAQQIPAVNQPGWIRNPIDCFVLAKLEARGLTPAPPADKYTLLRRVTYDLTGLPVTADDVDAFLADNSPTAYLDVVDRLLASPRYGERWGRHWLDLVRYSDDFEDAWRYRDWVVRAWNQDLGYNQFVIRQIAGDLLPPSDGQVVNSDGIIATTMLSIGPWGGIDRKKRLADIVDDQIDTIGRSFLGLTLACARCHDHKFDPLSTADYYALAGIFYSSHVISDAGYLSHGTKRLRIPLASSEEVHQHALQMDQVRDLERKLNTEIEQLYSDFARSLLPQTGAYLQAAYDYQRLPKDSSKPSLQDFAAQRSLQAFAVEQWIEYLNGKRISDFPLLDVGVADYDGEKGVHIWRSHAERPWWGVNTNQHEVPIETFALPPRTVSYYPSVEGGSVAWKSPIAGRVRISGRLLDADPLDGVGIAWVIDQISHGDRRELSSGTMPATGSIRLEAGRHPERLEAIEVQVGDILELQAWLSIGDAHYDVTTVELQITDAASGTKWDLTADVMESLLQSNPHGDSFGHADVWSFHDLNGGHRKNRMPAVDQALAKSDELQTDTKTSSDLGSIVEAVRRFQALIDAGSSDSSLAQDLTGTRSPFWVRKRDDAKYLSSDVEARLTKRNAEIEALKTAIKPLPYAHGIQEGGLRFSLFPGIQDARIHLRGSYEQLGVQVVRRFPGALMKEKESMSLTGSGRREFAEWIASPENPVSARVIVNRIWQHHFGEGIVRTPSNFGELGERPSHPELLDWLALRFIASGWSIKDLTRLIVDSATYQQSTRSVADQRAGHSSFQTFGRMERRRLEAEALRDSLLAVCGRLDERLTGPAVGANSQRRMLYLKSVRGDNSGFGTLFDAADPSIHVEKRSSSTVAPQALDLMNGKLSLEAATELGRQMKLRTDLQITGAISVESVSVANSRHDRIRALYRQIFGRTANDEEIALGDEFLTTFAAQLPTAHSTDDVSETWEAYAQVLLLSNQFLFVD